MVGEGLFKGEPDHMSNYLDRFKMASCLLEAWWFLDSKPDRNIPSWSEKWKRNMLQNTRLQTNGCQSPKRDDDMNDWCVKTCQDREDYKFTNSQIPRLLRQKVMAYCGINLQTSKALGDTNQFFFWYGYHEVLQIGERSTWFDFLLFHAWPRKLSNVRCFSCKSGTMGVTFSRNQTRLLCNSKLLGVNMSRFRWTFALRFKKYIIITPYIVSLRSRKDSEANDTSRAEPPCLSSRTKLRNTANYAGYESWAWAACEAAQ